MPPRKRVKRGENGKDDDIAGGVELQSIRKPGPSMTVRKSRNTGKLARMLELPLEVFTEIASYMTPYDILQLARSTKALREMFMSKRSKHVWVASRVAMGIPDLDNFSEPHYADLLFSKRCHTEGCDDNRATKVLFASGIRLCKRCFERATIRGPDMINQSRYKLGFAEDADYITLLPIFRGGRDHRFCNTHFLESSFKSVVEKFGQCKSDEEKKKFIADIRANTGRLKENERQINVWCGQQAKTKHNTNAAMSSARQKSIKERLLTMGYTADDLETHYDKDGWKWDTLLDQPRQLTETIWKKILPQLEETLRLRKDRHRIINHKKLTCSIENRFTSLWHSNKHAFQIASINPTSLFDYFPDFKTLINDPNCVGPVPDDLWKALDDGFEDAAETFAKVVEDECAAMMDNAYQIADKFVENGTMIEASALNNSPGAEDSTSIPRTLLRGTSLFKHNKHKGKLISYAGILKLRARSGIEERSADWQKEDLEVPEGIIGVARALLQHMSLPETSSMLFLEKLGKQFRCDRCLRYKGWPGDDAMTWSGLVWHFYASNKLHEDRIRKRQELSADVPLRNEHDLAKFDGEKILASMSPSAKQIANSTVDDICDGDTYVKLSEYTLIEWGYDTRYYSSRVDPKWGTDADAGNETDEELPVWTKERNNYDWSCKLCAKLGIKEWNASDVRLGGHMKRIHGTDFDGLPLVSKLGMKSKG